jgi:hypothetical protein
MAKSQNTTPAGSDAVILPDTPVFPEITGIKTALGQMDAFVGHLSDAVAASSKSEQTAQDMGRELELSKDNPTVRALLSLMPEAGTKLKESVTKQNRKAVNEAVQQIRTQQGIVAQRLQELLVAFGSPADMNTKGQKKANPFGESKKNTGNLIDQAVLDSLSPDFVSEFNVTFVPEGEDGYFRVFGTGHKEGTVYKSNLKNW